MFFVVDGHPGPLAVDDRGKREDMVVPVDDQREEREVFDDLRIVPALRVLLKDLLHGHLFGIIERDELPAPRRSDIPERRL